MIILKMDEALARSMQAQLNAEDGVTSSSSSTSTSTSSGQINSQNETRRFASGTSTTRLIVNGIETDMENNQNDNSGAGSATGSSTGSSVRSSNSRIRRWTPELGIIPDSPSGNSGEHDSNRFPGSGNTLGDPVITRETSKQILNYLYFMKLYHTVPHGFEIKSCDCPSQLYRSNLKAFDYNRICPKSNGSVCSR